MSSHQQWSTLQSAVGAEVIVDGKRFINFAGSAYLGLASNTQILERGVETLRQLGSGAPLARYHRIATQAHQQVEADAAEFFGAPAAMYLASGYLFGLVALSVLKPRFTTIFFDEFAHHSLREAINASGLEQHAYHHLDPDDLRWQLAQKLPAGASPLIVTDGMYSTLGEIAPLRDLWNAVAPYGGRLLVDESHAFGVLGARGQGSAEHHGLSGSNILIGGSFGKAFGVCGGIVLGNADEVAACRATPTGRGASAGLPAAAAMCAESLRYINQNPEVLQRLRANIVYAKAALRALGLSINDEATPVAAFRSGSKESMLSLRAALKEEGVLVYHSQYIGAGTDGVIRCGLFADHTHEHIDTLVGALRKLL